jgi:hypothetical protein
MLTRSSFHFTTREGTIVGTTFGEPGIPNGNGDCWGEAEVQI